MIFHKKYITVVGKLRAAYIDLWIKQIRKEVEYLITQYLCYGDN